MVCFVAVIEHVRDGCTVRAFLLPDFQYVTVMLAGVKAPMTKMDGTVEPFAEQAKYFVESRLLQKDVEILLEGVSNQNLLGTVLHPVSDRLFSLVFFPLVRTNVE